MNAITKKKNEKEASERSISDRLLFLRRETGKKKCKTLSLAFLGEAIATSKTERGAHTDTHTHRHSTLENTPRITQTRAVQSHRKTDLQQTPKQKKKTEKAYITV